MKKIIINWCINIIKKYKDLSNDQLEIIKYGLEAMYLTITKLIIIILIAILLNILKKMLIFFLLYGILRSFSYGLHATKTWICLLTSIIIFDLIPFLIINLNLNIIIKLIICLVGTVLMLKNSPADTYKKPIISKKKRLKSKIISTMICLIYTILCLVLKNNFYSNCFVFAIIIQNIFISPVTYKLFNLPYNNYIAYLNKHSKLNNL